MRRIGSKTLEDERRRGRADRRAVPDRADRVGGLAFDYARMASLDTELQDAADQAALAAASQLDRRPDAAARDGRRAISCSPTAR